MSQTVAQLILILLALALIASGAIWAPLALLALGIGFIGAAVIFGIVWLFAVACGYNKG